MTKRKTTNKAPADEHAPVPTVAELVPTDDTSAPTDRSSPASADLGHPAPASADHGLHHPGDVADEAHGPDDHGETDGHDDHAHGGEALGPIDVQAWGALALGVGAGLLVVVGLLISTRILAPTAL